MMENFIDNLEGGANMDQKKFEKKVSEIKDETKENKPATSDSDEGSKPKTNTIVDDANLAAERLEAANAKQEELISKQEELMAKQRLSGQAEAGQATKEETDDEKWAKEAKERYAGTGMDPTPNEDGK